MLGKVLGTGALTIQNLGFIVQLAKDAE